MWNQNNTNLSPTLGKFLCAVMSTFNLAEPEWISIACLQRMPINIVCVDEKYTPEVPPHLNGSQSVKFACGRFALRRNNSCFFFIWFGGNIMHENGLTRTCRIKHNSKMISLLPLKELNYFFETVSSHNFTVISVSKNADENVTQHCYQRVWFKIIFSKKVTSIYDLKGYCICSSSVEKVITPFVNIFICNGKEYISSLLVLDGNNDCRDDFTSTDEQCFSPKMNCPLSCQDPLCTCSPLQYKTKNGHCISYLHNLNKIVLLLDESEKGDSFLCSNNHTISKDLLNDFVADCPGSADDEPIYTAVLKNLTFYQCKKQSQIPCLPGHFKCYSINDICIYELDKFGYLVPCRIGSHVESCSVFECNAHFKCPGSYCIPWYLVCNGNWDCPYGEDESKVGNNCIRRKCHYLFKCSTSSRCIHPEDICDGKPHCPFGDDEQICHYTSPYSCPEQCHCFNLALSCIAIFLAHKQLVYFNFRSFHIVECGILTLRAPGQAVWLASANFTQNKIIHICNAVNQFPNIVSLDMTQNHITELCSKCFHHLGKLKRTRIKKNQLRIIQVRSFTSLQAIRYIDISQNFLLKLYSNTFENIPHEVTIDLSSNLLYGIDIDAFQKMCLQNIITDSFPICCITPSETTCFSNFKSGAQITSSCSELLANKFVKVYIAFFCIVLLVFNCLSIIVHSQTTNTLGMYNTIIIAINVGHLMSVNYLGILLDANLYYQRKFIVKQVLWTKNTICTLAFASYKFFNILLPFMIALLSFGRMMIIIFPLSSQFRSESFVRCFVTVEILIAACLSATFTSLVQSSNHSLNKFCSQFTGTKASAVVQNLFVNMIQLVFACFVPVCDICMLRSLHKQQKALQELGTTQRVQKSVQMKLTTTSVPNVLCWTTSSVILICFQYFFHSDEDMFVWPLTLIMPINGIINPLIFIAMKLKNTNSLQKHQKKKLLPTTNRNTFIFQAKEGSQ